MSVRPVTLNHLLAVRQLAEWAPKLRAEDDIIQTASGVLRRLADAARRQGDQAIEDFQKTVQQSSRMLAPLGEPLVALDFAEHRWVAAGREEAYSDWLQWIMAQANPPEVLRVFGVRDPEVISACAGCEVTVVRERWVPEGHEGSSGRLDLEIQLGDVALLVIEVKLGEADSADTEKGMGYCHSVEAEHQDRRIKRFVILVLNAADEDYHGFRPRLWADVCVELRLIAVRLCAQSEYLRAATILAFVVAVEQNILGLGPVAGSVDKVVAALALPRIAGHLQDFLEACEDGKKNR